MQFAQVTKNDDTRRKQPQVTSVEIVPNTMHLDMPTGSQSAEEVLLPTNRREKSTPQNGKKHHRKKGHTDIIKMEESDGQYDEIDVYFVGPYPDMASDPDEIMNDDPGKQKHITLCTFQLIVMARPIPLSE